LTAIVVEQKTLSNDTDGDILKISYRGKKEKPGDLITIEFDAQQRDRYDRLLGYVCLSNGKMLNEDIVKAGYANVMTIPPNVKYQDRFLKAYKQARERKRGLWR
jgi:micrococcal nuclease